MEAYVVRRLHVQKKVVHKARCINLVIYISLKNDFAMHAPQCLQITEFSVKQGVLTLRDND